MEKNKKALAAFITIFILANIIYATTMQFPKNPLAFIILELVLAVVATIILKIFYLKNRKGQTTIKYL